MARNYNPDYFKVGGSSVGDRDQASASRSKLAYQAAVIHHAQKGAPLPGGNKAKQGGGAKATPAAKPATARQDERSAKKSFGRSAAESPSRKNVRAIADVRAIQIEKPKHGKKRRSTKKRHAVGVLNELRANPDLSPQQASESLRTSDRPIADVIDVRKNQTAREVPESALPNAAPREKLGGVFGFAQRGYRQGQKLYEFARDFVTAPVTIARILRGLRERDAR